MIPLTLEGFWWLPSVPNEQQSGKLTFDQIDGGRLNIIGSLSPWDRALIDESLELSVIHGLTVTGKKVTLLHSHVSSRSLNFPGIATEIWHVLVIAIGAHFASSEEAIFRRSWIRFEGIAQWLEFDPFREVFDFATQTIELTVRKPIRMELGRIEGASIYSDSSLKSGRDGSERWSSTSESMIAIDADEHQSLDWHFSRATRLRNLAEMLFGRPLHLFKLLVEIDSEKETDGPLGHCDVEVYAKIVGGRDQHPSIVRPPMLTAPALVEAAPNALRDWFLQYDKLSVALNLLPTIASDRIIYVNVRFLLAVQAIETFHRNIYQKNIINDAEHAELLRILKKAIPSNVNIRMRKKIKYILKYSNEPSLQERLDALISVARDGRSEVMPSYSDNFVSSVVSTRNYETHHGARPRNLLSSGEMYWAIRRLVVLITVLMLRQIGLKTGTIEGILEKHNEFHRIWTTTDTI